MRWSNHNEEFKKIVTEGVITTRSNRMKLRLANCMFSCKLPPSLVPSSRSEVLGKIFPPSASICWIFPALYNNVRNLGREKIDFIGIAALRVTKTSLLWPTYKNRNKHLKINTISLRIPTGRGQTIWLFASVTGGFNSGLVYREQIPLVVRVAIELRLYVAAPEEGGCVHNISQAKLLFFQPGTKLSASSCAHKTVCP